MRLIRLTNCIILLSFLTLGLVESRAQRYNLKRVDVMLAGGQLISGKLIGLTTDSLIILDKTKLITGCVVLIKLKYSESYIQGTVKAITEFSIILTTKEPPHEQQIQKSQIKILRIKSYPEVAGRPHFNRSAYCYTDVDYVGIHKMGSGTLGALIGGAAGAGLGYVIGYNSASSTPTNGGSASSTPTNGFFFGGSIDIPASGSGTGILGFLIGAPIGAAIGSSNKKIHILGKRESFDAFRKKVKVDP